MNSPNHRIFFVIWMLLLGCGEDNSTDESDAAMNAVDAAVDVAVDAAVDAAVGIRCGGQGNAQCVETQYCKFEPEAVCGTTDVGGVCKEIPDTCPLEYEPVCGCDGLDYMNWCRAATRGKTSVANDGNC